MSEQEAPKRPAQGVERTAVKRWRRKQFLALGFTPKDAEVLTKAPVDVALVRKLVAADCPLETVRRIVL
jgi:hypothetical protein